MSRVTPEMREVEQSGPNEREVRKERCSPAGIFIALAVKSHRPHSVSSTSSTFSPSKKVLTYSSDTSEDQKALVVVKERRSQRKEAGNSLGEIFVKKASCELNISKHSPNSR